MAKPSLRTIRRVAASTKARILEAAEEVFAAKGFEGASTREIAAKAGVNISSLHYHWESKETLYGAVFRNIDDRLTAISRDSVPPAAKADPPGAAHEGLVGLVFDHFAANPNVPRLLLRRILENEGFDDAIERAGLLASWNDGWTKGHGGKGIEEVDARIRILTLHSVLLLFTLDSRQFARLLGGRIGDTEIARRVRDHLVRLSALLVSAYAKTPA